MQLEVLDSGTVVGRTRSRTVCPLEQICRYHEMSREQEIVRVS